MIRVSKKGVILIEPNDVYWNPISIQNLFRFLKGSKESHSFEEIGNYVYTISKREVIKLSLGMGITTVAFKGLNDCYLKGVEYEKADKSCKIFNDIQRSIKRLDIQCRFN